VCPFDFLANDVGVCNSFGLVPTFAGGEFGVQIFVCFESSLFKL
jgi:hypothetical protein